MPVVQTGSDYFLIFDLNQPSVQQIGLWSKIEPLHLNAITTLMRKQDMLILVHQINRIRRDFQESGRRVVSPEADIS